MEKRFFPQASFLFFILLLLIQVLWSGDLRQPGHHLPYRDALATEIAFWKLIFTRYSQDEYVIHDSEHLEIIYKVVAFDSSVSERVREKQLKKIKKEIKKLLLDFHHQRLQPQDLTPWELSIYHKFSRIKEHHKFFKAARRIRVQQGIRENFLAGVKRSFAYLPYLEKVFREEGLPHDLIYLPHVESSFNPEAVSHVGAVGMWQFMRSTARRFMKVNRIKDGRFDPLESTRAAARLLKRNYEVLHDWALAITAYNHGLAGMKRARRRYGNYLKIRDRYLRRSFGFASKNFYPEFLAVVEIMDSLSYYFPNIKGNQPLEFQEIRLPTPIKMTTFAHQFGLDLKELKRLNPGYRIRVWRGIYRIPAGYTLRLPPYVNAGE
ncbi:MAG: lytic transglycosylase domain-containing protein, partial [Calditrichaeota bacterium]